MIKRGCRLMRLLFVPVLTMSLLHGPARAADDDRPIRLYATAAFGPIGKLFSLGAVSINGRRVYGEQMIWGGELLQVSDSACALLEAIGRVSLVDGATARLAVSQGRADGADHFLIASLVEGKMRVKLRQGVGAYIEAFGSAFAATSGASFEVSIQDGETEIETIVGAVNAVPVHLQPDFIPIMVVEDPRTGRPKKQLQSRAWKVRTGSRTRHSVQIVDRRTRAPAGRGRPVAFAIDNPLAGSIGSQSIEKLTNEFGVATAIFSAGSNPATTEITVTDVLSGNKVEGQIIVERPGFWTTRNKILLGAFMATGIVIVDKWPRGKGPIRQVPPTNIP